MFTIQSWNVMCILLEHINSTDVLLYCIYIYSYCDTKLRKLTFQILHGWIDIQPYVKYFISWVNCETGDLKKFDLKPSFPIAIKTVERNFGKFGIKEYLLNIIIDVVAIVLFITNSNILYLLFLHRSSVEQKLRKLHLIEYIYYVISILLCTSILFYSFLHIFKRQRWIFSSIKTQPSIFSISFEAVFSSTLNL